MDYWQRLRTAFGAGTLITVGAGVIVRRGEAVLLSLYARPAKMEECEDLRSFSAEIGQVGSPVAAVAVTFTFTTGPDDAAVRPQTVVTDPSGQAIFRFTNRGGPGTDTIEAGALGGSGTASVTFRQKDGDPQQGGGADEENHGPQ